MRTFLAFMEDGWAWVIVACLFWILDLLAASLVDTLGSHCSQHCEAQYEGSYQTKASIGLLVQWASGIRDPNPKSALGGQISWVVRYKQTGNNNAN